MGKGYCFEAIVLAGRSDSIRIWEIQLKAGGTLSIGVITWSPSHRAYLFSPKVSPGKRMDAALLLDLGKFCQVQTQAELQRKIRSAG